MKLFVYGYYGCGNFGDEMMLEGLIDLLGKHHNYIVTGYIYNIKYDNVEYYNLHQILADSKLKKFDKFFNILKDIYRILNRVDEVYIGGGTLITNNTSSLLVMLILAIIAKLKRKKLTLISIGIEKLSLKNLLIFKILQLFSDEIKVRDSFTLSNVKGSTFIKDLAIKKFDSIKFNLNDKKTIIAPALFDGECIVNKTKQYISFINKLNLKDIVLFSSLNKKDNSDLQLCKNISKEFGCEIIQLRNSKNLVNLNYYGDVISERYHIGILSCYINSRLILVGTSQKIKTLARSLEVNVYDSILNVDMNGYKKPNLTGIFEG